MAGPGTKNTVGKVGVRVVPDTSGFRQMLKKQLEAALAGFKVEVPVTVDERVRKHMEGLAVRTKAMSDNLRKATQSMQDLTKASENTDFAWGQMDRGLSRVGNAAQRASRKFLGLTRVGWMVTAVFAAIPPVVGLVAALLAGIPSLLAAGGAAAAAVALGFDGIKDAASVLKDEVASLKKAVSDTFRKEMLPAMKDLEKVFPSLEKGMVKVASALSTATREVTGFLSSAEGTKRLERLLTNIAGLIEGMSPFFRDMTDALLTLADEAGRHFQYLYGTLNQFASEFKAMIDRVSNDGTLEAGLRGLSEVLGAVLRLFNTLFESGLKIMAELGGPLADLFDALSDTLEVLLPPLTDLVKILAGALKTALETLNPLLEAAAPLIVSLAEGFATLLEALAPFVEMLAPVLDGLSSLNEALGGIPAAVIAAVIGLGALRKALRGLRGLSFANLIPGFGKGAGKAGRDAGRRAGQGIGDGVDKQKPKITSRIGGVFNGLAKATFIVPAAAAIGDAFGIKLTDVVTGRAMSMSEAVQESFRRLGTFLETGELPKAVVRGRALVTGEWDKMQEKARQSRIEVMKQLGRGIFSPLKQVTEAAKADWGRNLDSMTNRNRSAWQRMFGDTSRSTGRIAGEIGNKSGRIPSIWGGGINRAADRNRTGWWNIRAGARDGANGVIGEARRAKGALSSGWYVNLYGNGFSIIDGLKAGMAAAFGGVMGWVGWATSWIASNKGPISYDRVMLIPAGRAIIGGLERGLREQFGSVQRFIATVAPTIGQSLAAGNPGVALADAIESGTPAAIRAAERFTRLIDGSVSAEWNGHVSTEGFNSIADQVAQALQGVKIEIGAGEVTRVTDSERKRNVKR